MTRPSRAEIEEFAAFAGELADAAGKVILPCFRRPLEIEDKGGGLIRFDPVTSADREAEMVMRRMIRARYPSHNIIGEEHGHHEAASDFTWVLDPIDGTRAFISGLPLWGVLIALNDGAEPVIGIIDQPYIKERFVGQWGSGRPGGATLNGKPIKTRACASLAAATLSTTDPELFEPGPERQAYHAIEASVKLRRYGYDCYAYAMLALGAIDLVIEAGLKTHDVQALIPVIKGAGGVVTDWRGNDASGGGQIIAAGDARVHAQALAMLKDAAL